MFKFQLFIEKTPPCIINTFELKNFLSNKQCLYEKLVTHHYR